MLGIVSRRDTWGSVDRCFADVVSRFFLLLFGDFRFRVVGGCFDIITWIRCIEFQDLIRVAELLVFHLNFFDADVWQGDP